MKTFKAQKAYKIHKWNLVIPLAIILLGLWFINNRIQENPYSDETRIAQDGDSYSYMSRVGKTENEKTEHVNIEYKRFSGIETLWVTSCTEDTDLELLCYSEVGKGDFKVVLVDEFKRVHTLIEGQSENFIRIPVIEGVYKVKIIGYKASGVIDLTILNSDDVEIKRFPTL